MLPGMASLTLRICTLVMCKSSVFYSLVISIKVLVPFYIIHVGGPLLSPAHSCLPKAGGFQVLAAIK